MANIYESLFEIVQDSAAVGAVIGDRFYALRLPKTGTELPAAIFQEVTDTPIHTHDAGSKQERTRVQISCYGSGDEALKDAMGAADVIKALLDGFTGTMGDDNSTKVFSCLLADSRHDYQSDAQLAIVQRDYFIHY